MQEQHALTVVLVHGAWADGSSWTKVITSLQRSNVAVIAAPIPLTSLSDDVAALDRTIDRIGGPVVLVGHAYAGAVIGASTHSQVRSLVYIAALAPAEGETVGDVFYRAAPHPAAPELAPDRDGYIWLPVDAFAAAFAQHASAIEHDLLAAVQRPIRVDCIQQAVCAPRWKEVPVWYLQADEDRMIDTSTQTFMAERMGAHVRPHRVDHAPLISDPQTVVDVITEAIAATARIIASQANGAHRG
ncbi:alpha/beta fold hydrolase [Mycobacterium simiae]|uniref:Alpha/beta hydrolase n=1 Tax=Mycobacterium simiae TaxID=1784 RepID=A0A1X0XIB7_MYCSI|nr:alpha/beta hydrolase [Mycobacterium simiae]ORJ52626.1 alpha/beta hydrolase [Mycobacterium simiae]